MSKDSCDSCSNDDELDISIKLPNLGLSIESTTHEKVVVAWDDITGKPSCFIPCSTSIRTLFSGIPPILYNDTTGEIDLDIDNGLIIKAGKLALDTDFTTIVSPNISTNWTLKKNNGVTDYNPASSTSKNLIVDKGVVAHISSVYSYPTAGVGQGLPTSVSGSYGTSLPAPNTPSSPAFTNSGNPITSNTSFSTTLAKAKSGLPVVGGQVQLPTGNDTSSDSTSLTFLGRGTMIMSSLAILAASDIEPTLNVDSFQSSRSRTFGSVTSGVGNYTYYVYDAALGDITNVIQNDALPVFTAFQFLSRVDIVNAAGFTMSVVVLRSNATNAFSGAKLDFS